MECDKTETIPTPTQMVLGGTDVSDRLIHNNISSSSQPVYQKFSRSPTRWNKGKIAARKFANSQSMSAFSPQLSQTQPSSAENKHRGHSELSYPFHEDEAGDKIDEELEDDESEYSIYSSSLPVTSFIGIRPPASTSKLSPTVHQSSSSSSTGLISLSSSTFPSLPSPPTPSSSEVAGAAATVSAPVNPKPTVPVTQSIKDCDGMGVLCQTNINVSPLEKNDSIGFERAAASSSCNLSSCSPSRKNDQSVENLPDTTATSFPGCQTPESSNKQRFTFEGHHANGFKIPANVTTRPAEDGVNKSRTQKSADGLNPQHIPQFRRQLSKRKSESLLDDSPLLDEYNSDEDEEEDDEAFHSFRSYAISDHCAPASPKARRLENFDPYQVFEVQRTPCLILTVRVRRGRNITMGLQDYYDTPDPYINLYLRTSPEGRKSTTIKENNTNPVWEEEFTFYINFTQTNVLQITLMESNLVWFDQVVGTVNFDISCIRKMDVVQQETFVFNEVSEVDIDFLLQFDSNPTLRYSLCLSDAEKKFQELRKEKVFENMRRLLGQDEGPMNLNEVPNIAVIGSGGGFRALTGYSGVFKALVESGILDCTMYAGGLSGSSWLLSTLYSHPKWPNLDMAEFLDELMHSVNQRLVRFFTPSTMYSYAQYMVSKRREGQPVSFTDIFGRMVGETLMQGRMDTTLTDQRQKLKDGDVPMPLYTCVHVKKDVPARSFQEWVEFSPYEIGLPKYGTFMDSELFGSKFFMGKLVKQYKEQPLHFLQGIWGSAFCILFKRLLEDNRRIDPAEMIRQEIKNKQSQDDLIRRELGEELDHQNSESSSDCSDDDELDDSESSFESDCDDVEKTQNSSMDSHGSMPSMDSQENSVQSSIGDSSIPTDVPDGDSAYEGEEEDDEEDEDENSSFAFLKDRRCSVEMRKAKKAAVPPAVKGIMCAASDSDRWNASDGLKKSVNWGALPVREHKQKERHEAFVRANSSMRKSRTGSMSYWKRLMKGIVESKSWEVLSTRRGRAAVIHNFMRGLSLQQTYPLSPFTPVQERVKKGDEFDGIFEMVPTSLKHIYMVDAGLTFNSPYPLILRPQREVDIILSFDFSARPSDKHHPFKELLLAEKWANLNRLPFPPIDVSQYNKGDVKELYIFKHPTDPHCPVVLHFALVNNKFKYYSKPGVPRQTKEEFDFAEFDIFDDPKAPYSTFSFTYTNESFKRLSQLTEFNTLLHIDEIKEVIKATVKRKRENPQRYRIANRDVKLLRMKSVLAMKKKLNGFISKMGSTTHPSSSSTPLYTASSDSPSTNPFFTGFKREISLPTSADSSIFGTPQGSDIPDFGGLAHLGDGASHSPSVQRQVSLIHDKERREILLSEESVYGTPPDNEDCFVEVVKDSNSSSTTPTLPSSDSKAQLPFPSTLSSGHESSGPKVVIASQVRSRKESPPNPFFVSFMKSTMSSQTSSSSSSSSSLTSPISSDIDTGKHYRKSSRVTRQASRKSSPRILTPHPNPSQHLNQTTASERMHLNQNLNDMDPSVLTLSKMDGPNTGSTASSGYSSLSEKVTEEGNEIFSLAPVAFKNDGTPIMDSSKAKMFHDSVKAKRKLLRRQSTVSSLNNISLDESNEGDMEVGPSLESCSSCHFNNLVEISNGEKVSVPPKVPATQLGRCDDFLDLSQFQGTDVDKTLNGHSQANDCFQSAKDVINSTKLCCETQNPDKFSVDSGADLNFHNSSS